jgi:putative ABC transport system permease protein
MRLIPSAVANDAASPSIQSVLASGVILGSVAAWYLSAVSRAFLFRLEPTDPRAFAAAAASLLIAGFAASVVPARRAASVDPIVALRSE